MKNLYIEKINGAAAFIKNNLDKKITLSEIGEAAGIPSEHINQFFQAFTGDSLWETIVRFRIERAALELINDSALKVKDAAKAAGCKETAEFSSLFRERFSVSPTAWKNENDQYGKAEDSVNRYPLIKKPEVSGTPKEVLSSEIKELNEFSVAFIKHTGIFAGDTSLFIYLYNKLTSWAASQDLLEPEYENVVIYQDPVEIASDKRPKISLGIRVPESTPAGGDIGKMKISGGSYLVCRYNLHENDYTEAWRQVFTRWMPEHKAVPASGCRFEIYPANTQNKDRYSSIADLCIPVKINS